MLTRHCSRPLAGPAHGSSAAHSTVHSLGPRLPGRQAVPRRTAGGRRQLQVVNYSPVEEKDKLKAPNSAPAEGSPPIQSPQKEEDSRSTTDPARPTLPWPKKRGFVPVVIDKAQDTVRDVALHLRRSAAKLPTTRALDRFVRKKDGTLKLKTDKPVVLVLGSGWGAHSLIKVVDTDMFEAVVVSPRNHFLFTPMLPSTAVGTVEFRSLLEPIRIANPFATYFEAGCDRLDVNKKVAYCTSAITYEDGRRPKFEIPYDVVVVAVGEQPATFGVPGVDKYCFFMKEVTDTVELRKRIQECFELASLPGTTEEERKRVLHFVVVGGGPTGVEFAGTLNDFVKQDLRRKYPDLMQYVGVTLLQSGQAILTQFSESLQKRALENFGESGVTVRTGVRVVGVNQEVISLKGGEEMPYGVCVWSTGNAARPLVKDIVAQVPAQQGINEGAPPTATKLGVDPFLRIVGARDAIALGDCSAMLGDRLPATAQVAGQQGAYVARMINRGYTLGTGGQDQPPPAKSKDPSALLQATSRLQALDVDALEKKEQLSELDVMAVVQNDSTYTQQVPSNVKFYRKPFEFLSLGIMAYVGNDKALTEVEAFDRVALRLYGAFAYLLWRSVYITKQVSFRNRVLILADWLKCRVFGRDLSQF